MKWSSVQPIWGVAAHTCQQNFGLGGTLHNKLSGISNRLQGWTNPKIADSPSLPCRLPQAVCLFGGFPIWGGATPSCFVGKSYGVRVWRPHLASRTGSIWCSRRGIHLLKLPRSLNETSRTLQVFLRLTYATMESGPKGDVPISEVSVWSQWPQGLTAQERVW